MRALLVDDSRAMRRILTGILKSAGFDEVHEAGDGVEALDVLRNIERPDLALVDWNMPQMNGYEFVKVVRMRNDFDDMVIMMVTTETEMERVVQALEAGANEYIMKPFTKEVIQDKLELLGLKAAAA